MAAALRGRVRALAEGVPRSAVLPLQLQAFTVAELILCGANEL